MPEAFTDPHSAAMIAKVDATHAAASANAGGAPVGAPAAAAPPPPAKPQRPDNVPEKFWDAEKGVVRTDELLKSYGELESGKQTPPAAAADPTKTPEADPAKAVQAAGLDFSKLQAEFAEKGALSPETFAALEKGGIPKAMVDGYIEGQKAIAAQLTADAYATAGGAENFSSMVAWAASNLSPAEQAAFNSAVVDPALSKTAVAGLQARWQQAEGKDPTLSAGKHGGGEGADTPFASRQEVTAAMRDPRYKADPAYRASVERRVAAMETF